MVIELITTVLTLKKLNVQNPFLINYIQYAEKQVPTINFETRQLQFPSEDALSRSSVLAISQKVVPTIVSKYLKVNNTRYVFLRAEVYHPPRVDLDCSPPPHPN